MSYNNTNTPSTTAQLIMTLFDMSLFTTLEFPVGLEDDGLVEGVLVPDPVLEVEPVVVLVHTIEGTPSLSLAVGFVKLELGHKPYSPYCLLASKPQLMAASPRSRAH